MMALRILALLSTLLFVCLFMPTVFTSDIQGPYPILLVVYNSLTKAKNLTYSTNIAYRGILLGAMRTIQKTTHDFKFTIREDPNYGPFLVSVNGVAGDDAKRTYWQLLAQLQNGTIIRPDVGVGCYIPSPHEKVILKFTTW